MTSAARRWTGLIAAAHTPMRPDGSVDLGGVEPLAAKFERQRLDGVFVCGTTGEFASLTTGERQELAERWMQVARGRLPVVVHVGGTCVAESRELAAHASRIGADAVALVGPYFFRPRGVGDLVEYCALVAAAAPEIPFFYYHIPSLSGVDLRMAELLPRAAERIPNLAGVKFSHLDLVDLALAAAVDPSRLGVLFGYDEALLAGLAMGACGAVGTTYGFACALSRRIISALQAGDVAAAREHQLRSTRLIEVFGRYGGHPAMKAAMALAGVDCGPVRPPQRTLSPAQRDAMAGELELRGFFELTDR